MTFRGPMAISLVAAVLSGCATDGLGCPRGERGAGAPVQARHRRGEGQTHPRGGAKRPGHGRSALGTGGIWGSVERVLLHGQAALSAGRHDQDLMDEVRRALRR